jgi:hypothetical protein
MWSNDASILFNIFNVISCELYLVVIFGFYVVQIYGPDLD